MDKNFTEDILTFYKGILERFPGEKHAKSDTDTDVLCPAHPDNNPSLGVDLRRNGHGPEVKINCRSQGCSKEEILGSVGLAWQDLYFNRSNGHKVEVPGCTVAEYAAFKNLPESFLRGDCVSLKDKEWGGKPAVGIPYTGAEGKVLFWRYRTGLRKTEPDTRMRMGKGTRITAPYGLNWLDIAREEDYVVLVEGESDCHVLWYRSIPALGIPGAKNWKAEWSKYLDGIGTVLVAVEPDAAGEQLWSTIVDSAELASRLEKVRFTDAI